MVPKRLLRFLKVAIIVTGIVAMYNTGITKLDFLSSASDDTSNLKVLRSKMQSNDLVITSLQHQIEDLHKVLDVKTRQLESVKTSNMNLDKNIDVSVNEGAAQAFVDGDRVLHYVEDQKKRAAILQSSHWKNEYYVSQFTMFNRFYIYKLDLGLKLRPQDILSSRHDWDREFKEVIAQGVSNLNDGPQRLQVSPTYRFTEYDFLHGLFRTETDVGTQYILIFKPMSGVNPVNRDQIFRVTFFRPFAPLQKISATSGDSKQKVHFIVPLAGREDTFRVFLDYFKDFAVLPDRDVHLTVVYYGTDGLFEINRTVNALRNSTGFANFSVINIVNEEFSRGRALQHGVESLTADNPLMFFCDVDVGFTYDFLNQCRGYTTAGQSVFYPIVFSLFNPTLVYENEPMPPIRDRQVLKRDNGMWRDFGFGMSCQYLSDFKQIGGFDLSLHGWGMEDVLLYRKYSQSDKFVIRTPVYSLFHHWHSKQCDKTAEKEQFESCLRSKARTEGSQTMLGLQYFKLQEKMKALEDDGTR